MRSLPDCSGTTLVNYYVNGEYKHTKSIGMKSMSIVLFRIYDLYDNGCSYLTEDDLHLKNIIYKDTDDYNYAGRITSFEKSGFSDIDGVLRYYDGKGGYVKNDFFIGATKYMVSTDGEVLNAVNGVLSERTTDIIKNEFAKQDVELNLFQSFENTGLAFTNGEHVFAKGSTGNIPMPGALDAYTGGALIDYKNYRQSFKLVEEADGNRALYYHHSTANSDGGNDNYFNLHPGLNINFADEAGKGSVHDYYMSMDVKMGGANILDASLIQMVGRGDTTAWESLIMVSNMGGLYIRDIHKENLIGFLSEDEYTRISLATDKKTNKLYIYLNDILVTPDGVELFDKDYLNALNSKNNGVYEKITPQTAFTFEYDFLFCLFKKIR